MSSWEEIKKLAADLHRVQLGEASKRLAERNCIEIVTKLIANGFIDVVHSLNGKDYITSSYLDTQIKYETVGSGGRLPLTELQRILNVDYQIIENHANALVESDDTFQLCLGQLMTKDYLDQVCEEIWNRLCDEDGRLTMIQLTKIYDLPMDVMNRDIIDKMLANKHKYQMQTCITDGQQVLYTDDYIEEQRAIIAGAVAALTRSMAVSKLLGEINVEPSLFFKCFDEMATTGAIQASLVGPRVIERCTIVPTLYAQRTASYLKEFFQRNGYLDSVTMKKLGVADMDQYIDSTYDASARKTLIKLPDMILSANAWDEMEMGIVEAMQKCLWVDIKAHVHPSMSPADVKQVVSILKKKFGWTLLSDTIFYNRDQLTSTCEEVFAATMPERANSEAPEVLKKLRQQQNQAPQASGAGGAGGGGKKPKGGKKKKGRNDDDFDDDHDQRTSTSEGKFTIEFMSVDQLTRSMKQQEQLRTVMEDCPSELAREIADTLRHSLNAKYRQMLESVFVTLSAPDSSGDSSGTKKMSHGEFDESFRRLYHCICIFDTDASSCFTETIADQLKVHLLRSLCVDLFHLALGFYTKTPNVSEMAAKSRDALIDGLAPTGKEAFKKLASAVNGKEMQAFYDAVDLLSAPDVCSLKQLRTPDKKIRTTLCERHVHDLEQQLSQCHQDAATGLLLACLLLISRSPDHFMVHATGKFVPHMVSYLKDKATPEISKLLHETQNAVVNQLKAKDEAASDRAMEKFQALKAAVLQ